MAVAGVFAPSNSPPLVPPCYFRSVLHCTNSVAPFLPGVSFGCGETPFRVPRPPLVFSLIFTSGLCVAAKLVPSSVRQGLGPGPTAARLVCRSDPWPKDIQPLQWFWPLARPGLGRACGTLIHRAEHVTPRRVIQITRLLVEFGGGHGAADPLQVFGERAAAPVHFGRNAPTRP
jgi:hypothetical protein